MIYEFEKQIQSPNNFDNINKLISSLKINFEQYDLSEKYLFNSSDQEKVVIILKKILSKINKLNTSVQYKLNLNKEFSSFIKFE